MSDMLAKGLAQQALAPRLSMKFLQIRQGPKNSMYSGSLFWTLQAFYQAFDARNKTTGCLYGLEYPVNGRTGQNIFRSLDGGVSWTILGEIPAVISSNERIKKIYVEPNNETIYALKSANITATPNLHTVVSYSHSGGVLTQLGSLDIGSRYWHAASHNIDSKLNIAVTADITLFAEYSSDDATILNVWRTANKGVSWTSIFSQTGNGGTGEIRHFHTLQVDPYTGHIWLGSGDLDAQSKIWKSTDDGDTWTLMASGSQETRTLGFIFESDRMYYGMDSPMSYAPSKIFRMDKNTGVRTKVADVADGHAVYSLTRTFFPEGFLVWTNYEYAAVNGSKITDTNKVQFFDYLDNTLKTVANISLKGIPTTQNAGFVEAARYQCKQTGVITVDTTANFSVTKYGLGTGTQVTAGILQAELNY